MQPKQDRIVLRAPQTARRKFALKLNTHTVFGVLFFVLGVIALIHPNFTMPGKTQTVTMSNQHILIETHRVISIPRAASATEVVLGIGLIIVGSLPGRRL